MNDDTSHRTRDRRDRVSRDSKTRLLVAGLVGGAIAAVTIIVLLVVMVGELKSARDNIQSTDRKATLLLQRADPIFQLTQGLEEQAAPTARRADRLLTQAGDVLGPLAPVGTELATLLDILPPAIFGGRDLIGEALPLLNDLNASELPFALSAGGTLAAQLLDQARLIRLIGKSDAFLDEVSRRGLLARAVKSVVRLRQLLRVQRRTFGTQRQTLAIQRIILDVQRKALRHVRNLDQKTGGDLTPQPVP
jgi:hypothetical protein